MVAPRLGVVLLGTCVLFGCNKETPPAAEEPRSASNATAAPPAQDAVGNTAPAAAADTAAPAGAAKFSDAAFELSVEPPKAGLKSGEQGGVEVVLVAKAPFHVNDKYPLKLKLKETAGIKYDKLTLGKDAAKVEEMKAVMPVSFTPEGAGKRTLSGQFAFSVCTEDKCLMEKRDLALDVVVAER